MMSWLTLFYPKNQTWKFCVDIFIRSVSRMGCPSWGTWRTLRVPDRRLWKQGYPWCHALPCLTPRKVIWKFGVNIFLRGKKVIHDFKHDPVLQVSYQEPSTSSKYPHEGPPILDTVLIKITQNFQGIFLGVNQGHPWYQGCPCSPSLRSGTLNVLQVPPF